MSKFPKPPLTEKEREKKAEQFASMKDNEPIKKEGKQPFNIYFPKSLHSDLEELSYLTGMTMNSICLEILGRAIKSKLKEIKLD